jgi:hypothetical protein
MVLLHALISKASHKFTDEVSNKNVSYHALTYGQYYCELTYKCLLVITVNCIKHVSNTNKFSSIIQRYPTSMVILNKNKSSGIPNPLTSPRAAAGHATSVYPGTRCLVCMTIYIQKVQTLLMKISTVMQKQH